MQWERKGLIFGANKNNWWMDNSALQPTPLVMGDTIRVFAGMRDKDGVSRVGYVDVDGNNPSNIIKVKETPCLDIGEPGCFDDNGVVPCALAWKDEKLYLFYAGYNLGHHVRMTIFSGLAVSEDYGETFHRCSKVPVMERTENETLFRVAHTVLQDGEGWKVYYGMGSKFLQGKKKTLPVYEVALAEVKNFGELKAEGELVLGNEGAEYRVGRPYVVKENGLYRMFFGGGTEEITYQLAYAESKDGRSWERNDKKLNLELAKSGWDSEMMAYPAFVRCQEKAYLFYNGNNYGYDGFGYAELIEE